MKVYDIFKQIETTSGKNDKIQIIKENADNEEFVEFLKFLYDEMITTGLSSKKINKTLKPQAGIVTHFQTPLAAMGYVSEFNTGTDNDILHVQTYLQGLEEPYRTFMGEVFTKSYKCGITASSVNKAINGLISEFKVMLAHPYEKYDDKIKGDFTITKKLDGHRTLAFVEVDENGDVSVKFRTRKGHEIHGLVDIEKDIVKGFSTRRGGESDFGIVLDGEITVINDESENVFQETSKIIRKDGVKQGLKFHVFDYVYDDEFWSEANGFGSDYEYRRRVVENMFNHERFSNSKFVVKVPVLYSGADKTQILSWSEKATELGWEGVMVNINDAPYVTKRTPNLLKVKKFHSCDGIIRDVYEGSAKYTGKLGGIVITFEDQVVNIGSGFTDHERELYWNNPELIVGKVGEYQYFERTENQNGGTDLRFATWKGLRLDKNEGDLNYE